LSFQGGTPGANNVPPVPPVPLNIDDDDSSSDYEIISQRSGTRQNGGTRGTDVPPVPLNIDDDDDSSEDEIIS
jgi:hypothetical protein